MRENNKTFLIIFIMFFVIGLLLFFQDRQIKDIDNRLWELEKSEAAESIQYVPFVPAGDVDLFNQIIDAYEIDPALASIIIFCESSWNPEAKNPHSTAKGLFQFTDGTWKWVLKRMGEEYKGQYDKELNIKAGAYLISKGELSYWKETEKCWKQI